MCQEQFALLDCCSWLRKPRATSNGGDGNSCGDGWEVFADVHVWSRAPGFPEAKGIAASVVERVTAITAVAGFAVIDAELQDTRALRDPDGLTSHIVCSFRFIIDQA